MHLPMLHSKIHRATVTNAHVDYKGSITVDKTLIQQAGLRVFQKVEVYNVTNGNRFETYVIEGEADSGTIQTNGAAAHLAQTGDLVIIAAYVDLTPEEADTWQPKLVFVDENNVPVKLIEKNKLQNEPVMN